MRRVFLWLLFASALILAVVPIWDEFAGTQKTGEATGENAVAESLGPFRSISPPRRLPEFRFIDESGAEHTLADFTGKTVLLNLWATWCPPCRKEMPSLDRLHTELSGDSFEVLTISTDLNGIAAVQEFFRKTGITSLKAYIDYGGETESALKIPGLPTTLLIDKNGNAIGVKVGPLEWDGKEVVAELNAQISAAADPKKI